MGLTLKEGVRIGGPTITGPMIWGIPQIMALVIRRETSKYWSLIMGEPNINEPIIKGPPEL